jgi:hypothetical protein
MKGRENDSFPLVHSEKANSHYTNYVTRALFGTFVIFGLVLIFLMMSNQATAADYGVAIEFNTPPSGIADVQPGVDYVFTVDVINTGTLNPGEDINFTVDLDPASISSGWTVTPSGTTIIANLQMGVANKTTESVTVRAPSSAQYQDSATIDITVDVIGHKGEPGAEDSLQLRANVMQVYNVLMSTVQDTKTEDPGNQVTFSVKVTNRGNGNDTFSFSAFGPELGLWSVSDVTLASDEYVIYC